MSRDTKPRQRAAVAARGKSGGGTLVGLFIGLVIGVLFAAGVVWYIHKTPPPFSNKAQPVTPSTAQPGPDGKIAPLALPGKPGDPAPQNSDKPRFDFYKILPGSAEAVPDPKAEGGSELKPGDAAKGKDAKDPTKDAKDNLLKEPVYLQTGSFQNASDADNQKAKLAMMGAEANVQQVMLQDKVWYRVRLGPFKKMDDVTALRAELAKQGIEANLVKKD